MTSYKGKKIKIRKEKPKVTNLVTLVRAFLAAENENRRLEDLPQADFGRGPKRFLLSVRTRSITENFVYWKLGPLFVFVMINACFHPELANALYFSYSGLSILLFSYINKVLSVKGCCVYMINKKNTWLLEDMKFLFSCSTRNLTRTLRSFVSYRVEHSKRNSVSKRAHVLLSI